MDLGSGAWHALDDIRLSGVDSSPRIIELIIREGRVRLVLEAEATLHPTSC